ncbi:hypothetical protein EYZ11_007148 [Aspergillus tanneri]|uniref:Uncharacterized protein n=1 Tax=Aspergillus tanneri TaxID=1220188 RepID=A0A4S3JDM6_9EURO|nr:hypothetical protein EYZ11_007148 [Aspergillus tanneri]
MSFTSLKGNDMDGPGTVTTPIS